ncbi:MAG: radical SAM protein [Proteobacteria bacterium]|nr:radical SAM protein [Pseudomonadota bacterium]MBU1715581.1 radical SAM protein [Pseudomonadota bacterium]
MSKIVRRHSKKIALLYRGPQGVGRDEFTSFVPAGFFNILKSLRDAGYRARLYNLSAMPSKYLKKALAEIEANAFFLSAFYGNHLEAAALAALLKKISPQTAVVLGGPFTVLGGEILKRFQSIDFVVQGEGEEAGVAILDALFSDGNFSDIAGLCRRSGTGIECQPARLLEDIDRFFYLPSEILPYCEEVAPDNLAVLISSRGCPYRCAFCSSTALWKNKLRHHSVSLLIDYLKDLRKTTGAVYFSLRDENFLAARHQVRDFTRRLSEENLFYLFNVQGSAGLVDEECAAWLASAGCDQLQMGVETVSPRLQQLLHKEQRPAKIRQSIDLLRRQLIRPFGYFIYGMGETPEEAAENSSFLQASGLLDAVAAPLVHYPGTALSSSVPVDSFFSKREILYFDEASSQKYRALYRKSIRLLGQNGGFRDHELGNAALTHLPATLARFADFLTNGQEGEAEKLLLDLTTRQPRNPWPVILLGDLYEERGELRKAVQYRRAAKKLVA